MTNLTPYEIEKLCFDRLSDVYVAWCENEKLPAMSAEELLQEACGKYNGQTKALGFRFHRRMGRHRH
jgi:hypothetical protein